MRRLITFFVDNYVFAISVFGALILFGAISALDRGIDLLPEFEVPVVAVTTVYSGAGPEEISRQVNEPIEGSLTTVPGISSVTSLANEGVGIVIAQFAAGVNVNDAAIDVNQRVAQVSSRLPSDASNPSVQKFNPSEQAIMGVAVSAPGIDLADVQEYAEDDLTPILQGVDGVADVSVIGPSSRQVQVLLDPDALAAYGIGPQQVAGAIAAAATDIPAGNLSLGSTRILITGRSTPSDVRAVEEIRVDPVRGIRVADVATVRRSSSEATSYARLDGEPTVLMEIRKLSGSNSVATAANVRKTLAQTELPAGYQATVVGDTTTFVADSVADTLREMLIAAVAVSLIVLLFVGRLGSVFAVVLAIPVSLAGALIVFGFFGFTFNLITLLAITVAIGLVVDDAIVVAENIDRYREMGYAMHEAVLKGAGEVSTAVLAATMSLLAVFLPISFLPGIVGQMFAQFGITLAATVAFSYLEAMFFLTVRLALSPDPFPPSWKELPPALRMAGRDAGAVLRGFRRAPSLILAVAIGALLVWRLGAIWLPLVLLLPVALWVLRFGGRVIAGVLGAMALSMFHAGDRTVGWVRAGYVRSLRGALRRPWLITTTALVLFLSLFWVFPRIGFNFTPPMDAGALTVGLKLPVGTSLDRTNQVTTMVEDSLLADPQITSVQTTVGSSSTAGLSVGGSNSNTATLMVDLVPKNQRGSTEETAVAVHDRLAALLRPYPEVDVNVAASDTSGAPPTASTFTVTLGSNDLTLLRQRAAAAVDVLSGDPNLRNVDSDLPASSTERVFVPDPAHLDGTGLTNADLFQALRAYNVGTEAAKVRSGGVETPIVVRGNPANLQDEQSLLSLPVYSQALRTSLPLGSLGRFETRAAPSSITRTNQTYSVGISADLVPGVPLATAEANAKTMLARQGVLDTKVTEIKGATFDLLGDLLLYGPIAFGLALLLNYLAIGSQFNSFRYPIYLMMTVPLALVGAVWTFYLTGTSLDVISILGFVMLIGLVTKNAILLLEATMDRLRNGVPLQQALVEAGEVRFRPIIMTTLTVVVISLPLLLGIGAGSEMRYPLGLVILAGVLSSALLTFYVVPAAFYQFEHRVWDRNHPTQGGAEPTPATQGPSPATAPDSVGALRGAQPARALMAEPLGAKNEG